MSRPTRLTPERRAAAICAILTTPTNTEAAKVLGVCVRTLTRFMSEPDFRADLDEARRDMFRLTLTKLSGNMGRAIETLYSVLENADASLRDKIAASNALIALGLRTHHDMDLTERIEALEDATNDANTMRQSVPGEGREEDLREREPDINGSG